MTTRIAVRVPDDIVKFADEQVSGAAREAEPAPTARKAISGQFGGGPDAAPVASRHGVTSD